MTALEVPDVLPMTLPVGGHLLVTSDLHFTPTRTEASSWSATEVAHMLDAQQGPGILVLAGDIIEMWAIMPADPGGSLGAHPEFVEAVHRYAEGPHRRVIYLPGNHDGAMAWNDDAEQIAANALHAEFALAVEVQREDAVGEAIRLEHGHAFDPANRFGDPRSPNDTPLGQHIVQEILPALEATEGGFLTGITSLADPRKFMGFVSSRIFYRKVMSRLWWLLTPLFLSFAIRIPLTIIFLGPAHKDVGLFAHELVLLDGVIVLDLVAVILVLFIATERAWKASSGVMADERGASPNDNAHEAAHTYFDNGFVGLISGHTHHAELVKMGSGFYANSGSGTKVYEGLRARVHLPSVYLPMLQLAWITVTPTQDGWTVELTQGRRRVHGGTKAETWAAKRRQDEFPQPTVTQTVVLPLTPHKKRDLANTLG